LFRGSLALSTREVAERWDCLYSIPEVDKRGAILPHYPAILDRVGRSDEEWVKCIFRPIVNTHSGST